MTAICSLPGSTTLGWHLGVVVFDVVTWARALD
jgi:hypothetical protein